MSQNDFSDFVYPGVVHCNEMRQADMELPKGTKTEYKQHHLCINCSSIAGQLHYVANATKCLIKKKNEADKTL